MSIVLPLVCGQELSATCFVAGKKDGRTIFATTLHQIQMGSELSVGIPAHGGDISKQQFYPITTMPTQKVEVIYASPIHDLALLLSAFESVNSFRPFSVFSDSKIGDEVCIVGYPYAPIGSALETAEYTKISAIGSRQFMGKMCVDELILHHMTHIGSSGSPVINCSNGKVCGMVRGCLAPPEIMKVGNIPLGADSSITYALSGEIINQAISSI